MSNQSNQNRRYELAEKFAKLSDALLLEATEKRDAELKLISGFISIMGSVIMDSNDIKVFSSLITMYSSNKLLSGIQASSVNLDKYKQTLIADEIDEQFNELRKKLDEEEKKKKKDENDEENSDDSAPKE
jgi:hypothetical protein